MVRDQLVERARDFDIILEDVAITDLSFSPQYTAAVEAKQIGRYRGGIGGNCGGIVRNSFHKD